MQIDAVISGFAEFILALVLAPCIIYVALRAFAALTQDIDEMAELKKDNVAVGIVLGSTLISTGLVIKEAIGPVIANVDTVLYTKPEGTEILWFVGHGLAYLVVATFLAVFGISIATRVFLALTHEVDELKEIGAGNVAVAITLAAAIIITGVLLADGTASLLSALIPDPVTARITG